MDRTFKPEKKRVYMSASRARTRGEEYYPSEVLKKQINEYCMQTGVYKSELAVRLLKSFFAARKKKGADPKRIALLPEVKAGDYTKKAEGSLTMAGIAAEIARKEKIRIVPTGQQALLQLGLSAEEPMKSVYLTDSCSKTIKIGDRTLVFRPARSKMGVLRGKISGPMVRALKTIGEKGIDQDMQHKLASLLSKEKPDIAEADALLAPGWIGRLMVKLIEKK
jgi:hypothetical protein